MKNIKFLILMALLGMAVSSNAQSSIRSSAIQIHVPSMNSNAQIIVQSNYFKWNGSGNQVYLGNLYPSMYQVIVLLGNRRFQTTVQLESGSLRSIYLERNGRLVQRNQQNSNQNVLPDPRSIPSSYETGVDDSWRPTPNTQANPYNDDFRNVEIPPPTVINRNAQSYQDWIVNFRKLQFDSDRVKYLKNTLQFEIDYITAKDLMKSITFDSDRLEAAKYIVPNLRDAIGRRNLVEIFSFDSNKQAYLKLLERYR